MVRVQCRYADVAVIKGERYGLETDIYGIGSSVWELVTGEHPYHDARSQEELMITRGSDGGVLEINAEWPEVCGWVGGCACVCTCPRRRVAGVPFRTLIEFMSTSHHLFCR